MSDNWISQLTIHKCNSSVPIIRSALDSGGCGGDRFYGPGAAWRNLRPGRKLNFRDISICFRVFDHCE